MSILDLNLDAQSDKIFGFLRSATTFRCTSGFVPSRISSSWTKSARGYGPPDQIRQQILSVDLISMRVAVVFHQPYLFRNLRYSKIRVVLGAQNYFCANLEMRKFGNAQTTLN